jgi:hypothetical protein
MIMLVLARTALRLWELTVTLILFSAVEITEIQSDARQRLGL